MYEAGGENRRNTEKGSALRAIEHGVEGRFNPGDPKRQHSSIILIWMSDKSCAYHIICRSVWCRARTRAPNGNTFRTGKRILKISKIYSPFIYVVCLPSFTEEVERELRDPDTWTVVSLSTARGKSKVPELKLDEYRRKSKPLELFSSVIPDTDESCRQYLQL